MEQRKRVYISYNKEDATTETIAINWASIVHCLTDILVWDGACCTDEQKGILLRDSDIVVLVSSGRFSRTLERETVACSTAGKPCIVLAAGDRAAPPEPCLPGIHVFNVWDANALATAREIVAVLPCQPQRVHSILTSLVALLYLE